MRIRRSISKPKPKLWIIFFRTRSHVRRPTGIGHITRYNIYIYYIYINM